MMQKILILVLATFSGFTLAQDRDVLQDIQMGMEGLKQAGKDPELLAQLMRDMQDPEMMAAAQEMMNDKKFQAEMKKFSKSKEFKESLKTTKEMLSDPNQAAAAEARMEQMIKVGNEEMKKKSMQTVDATMDAMANDPEMVDSMAKMIKDPNFKKQLDEMMKDPNFRAYMESMQEMLKDPSKKAKFDQAAAGIKAAL
ncbi:hypothetical protein ACA910_000703 [Epithemia clementina (nom. ined.)]